MDIFLTSAVPIVLFAALVGFVWRKDKKDAMKVLSWGWPFIIVVITLIWAGIANTYDYKDGTVWIPIVGLIVFALSLTVVILVKTRKPGLKREGRKLSGLTIIVGKLFDFSGARKIKIKNTGDNNVFQSGDNNLAETVPKE